MRLTVASDPPILIGVIDTPELDGGTANAVSELVRTRAGRGVYGPAAT